MDQGRVAAGATYRLRLGGGRAGAAYRLRLGGGRAAAAYRLRLAVDEPGPLTRRARKRHAATRGNGGQAWHRSGRIRGPLPSYSLARSSGPLSGTALGSRYGRAPYQSRATVKPNSRHRMPPTASSQKWLAVATMTSRVAAG